jgi:hypothetical protein
MTQSQESAAIEEQKLKEAKEYQVNMNAEPGGQITHPSGAPSTDQPWQEWVQPVFDFFSKLPSIVGGFFATYQQSLITIGLILLALVTVKLTLAVLDAINDIPLLAPLFELVGIGYTVWFVSRYLLKAETRQELGTEFNALKGQVVGKE